MLHNLGLPSESRFLLNVIVLSVLQHKLEGALLALGQFQHALDELLAWLTHTEELLSGQKKTSGDPKAIEIELAKHHVRPSILYTIYSIFIFTM